MFAISAPSAASIYNGTQLPAHGLVSIVVGCVSAFSTSFDVAKVLTLDANSIASSASGLVPSAGDGLGWSLSYWAEGSVLYTGAPGNVGYVFAVQLNASSG